MRDDGGVPVFSDRPEGRGFSLFLRTSDLPQAAPARHADAGRTAERMRLYSPLVDAVARQHALEPALLHAVIMVESGYNPVATSAKGAVGLMQLMPQTALRFGTTNRHDPEQNLNGGARYLSALIGQFGGDLSLALAAYNAGENSVRRWGMRIPPFSETQRYVPAVLSRYHWLLERRT
jgi:soluble lytic murein transglycosylase-like protein